MANRNFKNQSFFLEQDTVRLFGRCAIGAAGAVSSIEGTGISTITKESATGAYSVTLEDPYNKFLAGRVQVVCDVDGDAKTCLTGANQVDRLTFVAKASCTAGDFFVVTDTAGVKWAASLNITGTDPTPTSASYSAIPAAKKIHVDISGATTDANVATAVRAAFAALSGIGTTTTVSTVTGAYFDCTQVLRAPVAVPALYKENGTASPTSFTTSSGTAGVQTAVDPTNTTGECLTITSHGFETGKYVALSIGGGSLPTGWSATNYYVIRLDANRFQFATSLANAEAGTPVTISDYGTARQTITVTPNTKGSGVACFEFTDGSTIDTNVQAASKISFMAYDYAQSPVQIANGSKMYIELVLRNSGVKAKGES